jgi:FkbM family methyltransferase
VRALGDRSLSEQLQSALAAWTRHFAWRFGRRLYSAARGEPHRNDIHSNGESYVQRRVLAGSADASLNIVDIGANKGDWTTALADSVRAVGRAAGTVTVDLFEPVPATAERLEWIVRPIEKDLTCRIHRLAMSDKSGRGRIAIMSDTGGTNTLHAPVGHAGRYVEIETRTLDAFCADSRIARLQLAKSDTEGHDLSVLRGALGLLREGRVDVFQFEYNHRWVFSRSFLKDVFDLVVGLPYRVARIMPAHIEILPEWHPELERYFEANYLLVKSNALGWFNVKSGQFDASNVYRV